MFFSEDVWLIFSLFFLFETVFLSLQNHDGNGSSACLMNAPLKQQNRTTQHLGLRLITVNTNQKGRLNCLQTCLSLTNTY